MDNNNLIKMRLSKKLLKASRRYSQIPACVPKHFGRQEFADLHRVLISRSLLLRKSAIKFALICEK